jgi:hypothetical protein
LHGLKNEKASFAVSPSRRVKFRNMVYWRNGSFIDMLVPWIAPAQTCEQSNSYGGNKSCRNSSKDEGVQIRNLGKK